MNALIEAMGLSVLRQFDPEAAHGLAIRALRAGLTGKPGPVSTPRLAVKLAGMDLPNPVGLAAGFDKNATAIEPLCQAGFGFIEVGAATPLPQPGNAQPRLFRLTEDRAAINRFGFNNDGMDAICSRIAASNRTIPVGLNLGANKTSTDRAADFAKVMEAAKGHVDFATVNVSSPNTEKLRDLQGKAALAGLLEGVMAVRGDTPVMLKIAPDLQEDEIADVAQVAQDAGVSAIIATNTTLSREGLQSVHKSEAGGLSGAPLFEKSTRVLARLSTLTDVPIIGVGGISDADQAYAKICAGASAVQLYTALVFGGLSMVSTIARGIDERLEKDGFASVSEAVGSRREDWL
ncbi:quinone-dependent dihydroorotate dehydrogenase [Sulfitobacter donghicola]|uniref:quinone-dependent dihydroorotate dehydrogenase n=1 Tax=Sulfitobacter donghicola TaxID=421000 RepID=UPI00046A9542|nr:quinone-dependent dihydroorotate dehydrogenase [Sulfitobacter donghicola]KIN68704.1 Dihydroorotate oxidase [Sulfitobacter donghicola DSW-25 = KCTC 12864 = JCM 14565]